MINRKCSGKSLEVSLRFSFKIFLLKEKVKKQVNEISYPMWFLSFLGSECIFRIGGLALR